MSKTWGIISLAVLPLALAACAVGPDFERPAPPGATRYLPANAATQGASLTLTFDETRALPADWWRALCSPGLHTLVTQALASNADLQVAQAALRAASENAQAARGAFWPGVALNGSATHQKVAAELSSPLASNASPYRLHTLELDIAYAPDLFGLARRAAEGAEALASAQQFERDAVQVSLANNVVATAISESALMAEVRLAADWVDENELALKLTRKAVEKGALSRTAELAQEQALLQTRSQLGQLRRQLALARDAQRALLGRVPDDPSPVSIPFDELCAPASLPTDLPSQLAARRPDILAAEANLHAASAQAGVALAARLPQITLSGSAGQSATALSSLLSAPSVFWSIGAGVSQAIFQGGALLHRQRAAEAALNAAKAQYRSTVISAFQNVADALQTVMHDEALATSATANEVAARRLRDIAQRQVELGDINRISLLQAQMNLRQAALSSVAARAALFTDIAALNQALGGGVAGTNTPPKALPHQTKKS